MFLCILLACAASSGYWLIRQGAIVSNPENSSRIEQTELESLPKGNAEDGEQVFNGEGNCSACHATSSEMRLVGPSLIGIGSRAASYEPGLAAETYLWESIVRPDAYVVNGYPASVMPAGFGQWLSEQQIADLVAYLLTK
jgi:mono/diheme cytochrome c family protein